MKIFLHTICFLLLTLIVYPQKTLNVHKIDGTMQSFLLNNIDSITFSNSGGATCPGVPTVNYSGKIYNTVQIGTQCWLKENLDVGVMIPKSQNSADNGIIEKYCYDNSPSNCNTYGALYQWNEAMQYLITPGAQGICPSGWHIPTYVEFQTLATAVGNDGNALKSVGQGFGSGAGTNSSGFSALMAGFRYATGLCVGLVDNTTFWGSLEYSSTLANYLYLRAQDSLISFGNDNKSYGFSVRCLKD